MPKLSWNPPKITTKKVVFEWTANHASIVHNGSFGSDNVRIFPRPFVTRTAAKTDVPDLFENNFLRTQDFNAAFRDTAGDLAELFTDAIESKTWYYPTKTYRSNGSVATSPRDILDTKELRDSLIVAFF